MENFINLFISELWPGGESLRLFCRHRIPPVGQRRHHILFPSKILKNYRLRKGPELSRPQRFLQVRRHDRVAQVQQREAGLDQGRVLRPADASDQQGGDKGRG